jgi:hypothetical protein
MEYTKVSKSLLGISIMRGVKAIILMQFTYYTLLIGEASIHINREFEVILNYYLDAFRGLVNKSKCIVYGWNTPAQTLAHIAKTLNILHDFHCLSFKYLNIPVTTPPSSKID